MNESILLAALCWYLSESEVFQDKILKEVGQEGTRKFYAIMEKVVSVEGHEEMLFNHMIEQMKEIINKEGN